MNASLISGDIDLETIEGVDQLTKLVLMKTDSLPSKSQEKIDARYLNSLMETLYTGLRKPFKSVSADILGIFPTFEEVQVSCEQSPASMLNGQLEREGSVSALLHGSRRQDLTKRDVGSQAQTRESLTEPDEPTDTPEPSESADKMKYSMQVCKAVTNDCLSMDDLVSILPPSVGTLDAALIRLCPVMLFRIMNQLCSRPSHSIYDNSRDNAQPGEEILQASPSSEPESAANENLINQQQPPTGPANNSSTISLNTLQILKNLHNSDEQSTKNRPQRLHKKLKTQTNTYNQNGRLMAGSDAIRQQQGVDQQLLKIRLKLNEPSIEKVWIFSLLFVILSIVVSMGGLIVLPFVKKTTRKRILTLFEGLAVGGLAGSATLHMFPQAFGLVDENYHKYFWRIFVVFLGIYLCYLCERVIKILKVVRARKRRRNRTIEMERAGYCGQQQSFGIRRNFFRQRKFAPIHKFVENVQNFFYFFRSDISTGEVEAIERHEDSALEWKRRLAEIKENEEEDEEDEVYEDEEEDRIEVKVIPSYPDQSDQTKSLRAKFLKSIGESYGDELRSKSSRNLSNDGNIGGKRKLNVAFSDNVESRECPRDNQSIEWLTSYGENNETRRRLLKCLKSVQCQFSPVYAVYSSNSEDRSAEPEHPRNSGRPGRGKRAHHKNKASSGVTKWSYTNSFAYSSRDDGSGKRASLWQRNPLVKRWKAHANASKLRRKMKQREIETMLYHKHRMEQQMRMQQLIEEQERRAKRRKHRMLERATAGRDKLALRSIGNHMGPGPSRPLSRSSIGVREYFEANTTISTPLITTPSTSRSNTATPLLEQTVPSITLSAIAPPQEISRSDSNVGPKGIKPKEPQSTKQQENKTDYMQRLTNVSDIAGERQDQDNAAQMSVDTVAWMIVFGDAVLNVIDGLSIGAAFERNILAGISISVAVMLEEVTHRLGTFAVLIRAGMSMQQSLLCTFLSACALFPGLIVGILLSDATEDATPYIFCAAGGIFLYMALVDVMKEMNRSIENAIRKDIKSTLQIFALQNVGIILAVIFLSFLALYEQAMDFEEYQMQYNQLS